MSETAIAAVERLVQAQPVVSLKVTNGTGHQQKLLNLIHKLSDYIAGQKGVDKGLFWGGIEGWIKTNPKECTEFATRFACEYIEKRDSMKSAKMLVDMLLIAFKKWGIVVNERLSKVINDKKRKWDEVDGARVETNKKMKSDQYVNLKEHMSSMVRYTGGASAATFRDHVERARNEAPFNKSALAELKTIAGFSDDVIRTLLLKVHTFLLMSKVTGLRWVSFLRMTSENVSWRDGMLLIKYKKKHNSKDVNNFVGIVPNANAADCAVLAYSQYVSSVSETHPFKFSHKTCNSKARARVAALLDLVAWVVGSTQGMGFKKVHAMRAFCTTLLAEKKVGRLERHEHLGWETTGSTIERDHYLDGAIGALNSRVPVVAAGREDGAVAPPFWDLLGDVAGDDIWRKIATLSVAAKVAPPNFTAITAPDELVVKVQTHMADAMKAVPKTPAQLLQENKALTKEVQELKRLVLLYRTRLGETDQVEETGEEAVKRVTDVINALCERVKEKDFPRQCLKVYRESIENTFTAHPSLGFILPFNTAKGKALQAILTLVAVQIKDPLELKRLFENSSSRSWTSWVRTNKATIPALAAVPTSSVEEFKNHIK